jgi:hypothetical protein
VNVLLQLSYSLLQIADPSVEMLFRYVLHLPNIASGRRLSMWIGCGFHRAQSKAPVFQMRRDNWFRLIR